MAQGLFNLKQVMQGIQQGDGFGQRPPVVEYLVVAGGGGAGSYGGGGAGGLLQGVDPVPNGQTLLVTVGGGGGGADKGASGSNSVFGSITSIGGGGGGGSGSSHTASSGGSGGGGGVTLLANTVPGQGTSGQGNQGGSASIGNTTYYPAGGGGGAGTAGADGSTSGTNAGFGGAGIASAISGAVTTYAGGGGGAAWTSAGGSVGGIGGAGGGGNGGSTTTTGTAGTANTGGGGGGLGSGGLAGYSGGSGIVVVSYPDTYAAAASTTNATVSTSGSGSISFNGSSQWVTYASNAAWTLGSTFTIEAWVYPTVFSANAKRICQSDAGVDLSVGSTGLINFNAATTTTALSLNVWSHVAFVCSSGTSTLYINGVASGFTGTNTGVNVSGTSTLTVGTYQTNSGFAWQGYISNFRIVKNSAVYTGNFTPSTIPLTAITNTQLLLTANSGGFLADGSTNGFATTSTTSASPTWNSASPFTGTGYKNRVYTWTTSGSITF